MTIKEALETINGATITSTNVPIRKLQSAILTLMTAAKRAERYDKELAEGTMVAVPDCKKCAYNYGLYWHQCEHCIGEARNNFLSKEEVDHEAKP